MIQVTVQTHPNKMFPVHMLHHVCKMNEHVNLIHMLNACLDFFHTQVIRILNNTASRVSFKSNPSSVGLGNYFFLPLPTLGWLESTATGSALYYKLQPVVWIALKDRSTKKGMTYPHEGQFASLG